jgi:putative redox protein
MAGDFELVRAETTKGDRVTEPITTSAELTWTSELCFRATSGTTEIVLDSDGHAGPSPMQALAMSLAGCMAMDVVDIVRKGRHDLRGLRVTLTGLRAPTPPKRYEEITLHYIVEGDVPSAAVDRAVALSRETYCSVWQSMRQDIKLTVTHEIRI